MGHLCPEKGNEDLAGTLPHDKELSHRGGS
jgi:hypothetical protein